MKPLYFFLGLLMAASSSFSLADVQVDLAEGVKVLAVNGQEVDDGIFQPESGSVHLENGSHQLLVTYTTEIRDVGNGSVLDTSAAQVLRFEAQDSRLDLTVPAITNRHEMRRFDEGGQWRLTDSLGEPVPYESAVLQKTGLQFGRDFEAELMRFNQSDSPASMAALGKADSVFDSSAANPPGDRVMLSASTGVAEQEAMADQQMVGNMLQFWYQQASPTTRNHFKRWLRDSQ